MKYLWLFAFLSLPMMMHSQLGLKAGFNFANVTNAESINTSSRTGYHAGIFFSGSFKNILNSRSELLYSRQGYNFSTNTNSGNVNLDYLLLPQLFAINITPLIQVQGGGQIAYLLNAEVDSTSSTGNQSADNILDIVNRVDFGLGGGVEVHPISQVVIGARIIFSLGKLFKEPEPGQQYSFIPDIDTKSNLFQLYAGLRFGKN
ncbi:MAG: PorT family protein [Bacteroidota bacterium]|nr:PorT family protein [Bacteroidota bacterium]